MDSLVDIDCRAILELIENIAMCLRAQERVEDAIAVFEHGAQVTGLPGLRARIISMEAVWYAAVLKNRSQAREVLSEIDLAEEEDVEVLQACLDICELSMPDKEQVIDRILQKASTASEQLQYGTLKAIFLPVLYDLLKKRKSFVRLTFQGNGPHGKDELWSDDLKYGNKKFLKRLISSRKWLTAC